MKVIVTGARRWEHPGRIYKDLLDVFIQHGPFQLRHGACSTGADMYAHQWFQLVGEGLGCTELRFPANWDLHGPMAGPMRNQRMVEAGADLVLAYPLPEGSGTQHTMTLAREAGIEVIEHKTEG